MYNFGWLTIGLTKMAEFDALFHKCGTWTTPEMPLFEENFAMIKMNHVGKITDTELPLFAGDNAYLKDFAVSNDEQAPITAGLFRLEAGEPITYTYTYEEMKLIIDGEFQITDESGETVTARTGDLFYFPKGSVITFTTDTFGLGYFCGQRGADEA